MRRAWWVLLALALGGCPAAHSGYPTSACMTDSDCYLGERCMNNSICVPAGDDLSAASAVTKDMAHGDGGTP